MSAQELRDAAENLRAKAASAPSGPWLPTWDNQIVGGHGSDVRGEQLADCFEGREISGYIATMHPGVGLALARALDEAANAMTHSDLCMDCFHPTCLTVGDLIPVARLINGTEP